MKKTLILAGGGHAHMVSLANLEQFVKKGFDVKVIGPSAHHFYSGMGPGMLGKTYTPENVRFATQHLVEKKGGTFILGKITKIDAEARKVILASGKSVAYDVLSCNIGSHVPTTIVKGGFEDIYTVKPIERLMKAQQRILSLGSQKQISVGIVGGGPSALEIAGNVHRLTRTAGMKPAEIKLLTNQTLMPNHTNGIRDMARSSLKKRGIEILENCLVEEIKTGCVTLTSGKNVDLDIIFVAIGVKPNPVFKESGLPTGPDGGLLVNRFLQSTEHPNIFGGGDCIHFQDHPLDKVGVYAVRQNPILFHNQMAKLEDKDLQAFNPGGRYLLILNLGDDTGILYKWPVLFRGRLAFKIKDFIDRKFMKKFQKVE